MLPRSAPDFKELEENEEYEEKEDEFDLKAQADLVKEEVRTRVTSHARCGFGKRLLSLCSRPSYDSSPPRVPALSLSRARVPPLQEKDEDEFIDITTVEQTEIGHVPDAEDDEQELLFLPVVPQPESETKLGNSNGNGFGGGEGGDGGDGGDGGEGAGDDDDDGAFGKAGKGRAGKRKAPGA